MIGHPRPIVVAVVGVAMEAGCVGLLVANRPLLAMLLHGLGSALLAVTAWWSSRPQTPATAVLRTTALLQPFLGPVAAVACVVVLACNGRQDDPASSADYWHEHLFPNLAADDLSERTEAIRRQPGFEGAGEIESFFDVLRWGSLAEQEHVLSLISRSFRPEFAPVLRAGLAVPDLGLRAQAAAGLSLLEARTSTRLSELRTAYDAELPADRRAAATALARALADAAHSGLYDDARATEMRRDIVDVLGPVSADDPALAAMLGRTLIQLGEFVRAVAVLEPAAERDRQGAAFAWLVEGVFRQGDYARLGHLLSQHADRVRTILKEDGPLAPALRFWGQAA